MSNPYLSWERRHCVEPEDFKYMYSSFIVDKPEIAGWDTETTGLHIKKDKPFLIIFGWEGKVFTFEPNPQRMNLFFKMAKMVKWLVAWNTKYDCHMVSNIGYLKQIESLPNHCEGMALARLSLEAVPAREGGDSLQLKDIGVKYVHHLANQAEKHIKAVMKELNNERVKVLASALKQFDTGDISANGKPKKWGKGAVEKFLKDPTNDIEDLPEEVREVWVEWSNTLGQEVTYKDIYERDPEAMIRYAGDDVITMLEFVKRALPIVMEREQLPVLERENNVILPLFRMERVGIKTDREYLNERRLVMKAYITEQRQKLYEMAGEVVNCNQHDRIKKIFLEKWNIQLDASDKAALKDLMKKHEGEPKEFASLISELRTLEKWYSTYLLRALRNTEYDGRFYTQIAQCSAVSGRVGSDSQQMPKKAIKKADGTELFNVRKCYVPTNAGKSEGYTSIWYCDLSQVELRVAANYTLLVSGGDLNLCRAYFPFKCENYYTAEIFDPKNPEHVLDWDRKQPDGKSIWLDENKNPWVATDIHAKTTEEAYPNVDPKSDEFKELRGTKGKPTNFLCLYGGTPNALAQTLDVPLSEAEQLYNGYKQAFPHLDIYSQMVIRQHHKQGYVTNMLGRRYYLSNMKKSYKLTNLLIQGSCADDLKRAIIEIDELLLNYKTRLILTVHDEIQPEVWKGEEFLIPKILEIMGDVKWSLVPIECDAEVTYTTWANKEEVKL